MWGAVLIGLGWTYAAVARRLIMGQRVPGILLLTAVTLTARTVVALASGSVVLYFLQPTLGTALVAAAFLLSVPLGRPLAERLARDFCPIPSGVLAHASVRRFFLQITLLWAFTQLANATGDVVAPVQPVTGDVPRGEDVGLVGADGKRDRRVDDLVPPVDAPPGHPGAAARDSRGLQLLLRLQPPDSLGDVRRRLLEVALELLERGDLVFASPPAIVVVLAPGPVNAAHAPELFAHRAVLCSHLAAPSS